MMTSYADTRRLRATVALVFAGTSLLPLVSDGAEPTRVAVAAGYRAEANIEDGPADFSETRFSITGARNINLNERLQLEPILTYRFSNYDFSGRDPWEQIHLPRATVLARYALNQQWALFGGPSIGLAAESGADLSDSLTFGGAVGVTYSMSEALTLGVGLTASTEIEDDPRVRPIAIVRWNLNDKWEVEAGYTEVAAHGGPGGEVRYRLASQWSIGAGLQYQEKRFRLDEDGSVPDGVGEDTSVPLYARLAWEACPQTTIEFLAGVSLGGELTVENSKGHELREEDYDPAPLFGVRASITF